MKTILFATSVLLGIVGTATAADPPASAPMLKVGDKAPDFDILKSGQEKAGSPALRLSDFKGKKNVLVAFYPKAFTPGCTSQMCGYRDQFALFKDADTEIVAVSVDPQQESDRFKKEKAFPFYTVGDPEATIVKAYGVSLMDLPVGHLAKRTVFLVDKSGVIRYVDPVYDVEKGKEPLFKAMQEVQGPAAKTP